MSSYPGARGTRMVTIAHLFREGGRFVCGKPIGPSPWLVAPRDRERCVVCAALEPLGSGAAPPVPADRPRVVLHRTGSDGVALCGQATGPSTAAPDRERFEVDGCAMCAQILYADRYRRWARCGRRGRAPDLVAWDHAGLDEPGWISRALGR